MPSDIDIRDQRRQAIVQLLREVSPNSQGEIADLLKKKGHEATQSSISRDLRDLGVLAQGGPTCSPADSAADGESAELGSRSSCAVPSRRVPSPCCGPPSARRRRGAVAIDQAGWPEVAGTISGDDTIFIATADPRASPHGAPSSESGKAPSRRATHVRPIVLAYSGGLDTSFWSRG